MPSKLLATIRRHAAHAGMSLNGYCVNILTANTDASQLALLQAEKIRLETSLDGVKLALAAMEAPRE